MGRFSVTTPDPLHEWLSAESEARGIPMNSIVILALEAYKDSREKDNVLVQLEEIKKLIDSK